MDKYSFLEQVRLLIIFLAVAAITLSLVGGGSLFISMVVPYG